MKNLLLTLISIGALCLSASAFSQSAPPEPDPPQPPLICEHFPPGSDYCAPNYRLYGGSECEGEFVGFWSQQTLSEWLAYGGWYGYNWSFKVKNVPEYCYLIGESPFYQPAPGPLD